MKVGLTILLVAILVSVPASFASRTAISEGELVPIFRKESLAFHNVRYAQHIEGLRVVDAGAAVHTAKRDAGLVIERVDLAPQGTRTGSFAIDGLSAERIATASLGLMNVETLSSERVWAQVPGGLRKAYEVTLTGPAYAWRVHVDAENGAVLDSEDRAMRGEATARVFRVNPIVAFKDPARRDNAVGVDDGSFAGAFIDVELGELGTEGLAGRRVIITDRLALTQEADHSYRRDDMRFLETMVYHYTDSSLQKLDELGYVDHVDKPIRARAHAPPLFGVFPGAGPDAYVDTPYTMTFFMKWGTQLAASAEDAEIIVHELGHIVHIHAAPDVRGDHWSRFAEGASDFFAAAILESESDGFGDSCMFEWLATRYPGFGFEGEDGLFCMRVLDNEFVVGEDDFGSYAHHNGQFWSGALWDIRQEIGRNESIQLFMEALFIMPAKIDSFEVMGQAVMDADQGLTGGTRARLIHDAFAAKGIELPMPAETVEPAAVLDEKASIPGFGALAFVAALGLVAAVLRRRR